jgi:hypothetical protein
MNKHSRLEAAAALFAAGVCLVVFFAYLGNLKSGPFEDDFGYVTMAMTAAEKGYFSVWTDAFGSFFFRPLNMGLLLLSLKVGSWMLAHGAALVVHLCFSLAVAWLAALVLPGNKSRWLLLAFGCAFFVHQGNATTVLQLDTFSQSASDLFSVIALMAGVAYARSGAHWLILASFASLIALLSKEGGVSTPLAVIVTVGIFASRGVRFRKIVYGSIAGTAVGLVYFLWRANVQNLIPRPESVLSRYSFGVGVATLRNLGKFVFVETVPWNSASLSWNRRPEEWVLGLVLAVLMWVAALIGWGRLIRQEPKGKTLLIWLPLIFLIWCTPYVLLAKVSEEQVYRLASMTVLMFGLGCWAGLRSGTARLAAPALIAWCAWVGVGGIASVEKCALLKNNARVAGEMIETMGRVLGDVSDTREVRAFVVPSDPPWRRYSNLHVPEPALRMRAPLGLAWYFKKPDLKVQIFLPGETAPMYTGRPEHMKAVKVDIFRGSAERIPESPAQ